jgi:hypothetical protein
MFIIDAIGSAWSFLARTIVSIISAMGPITMGIIAFVALVVVTISVWKGRGENDSDQLSEGSDSLAECDNPGAVSGGSE